VSLAVQLALIALAAIVVAVSLARMPSAPERPVDPAAAPAAQRPEQLEAVQRLVMTSSASALNAHAQLRPVLVEIVAQRLAVRGRTLDEMGDTDGRRLLGDRLWELVTPDRPFPRDRRAAGIPAGELAAMLDAVKRL
jgi:hypothetical protein